MIAIVIALIISKHTAAHHPNVTSFFTLQRREHSNSNHKKADFPLMNLRHVVALVFPAAFRHRVFVGLAAPSPGRPRRRIPILFLHFTFRRLTRYLLSLVCLANSSHQRRARHSTGGIRTLCGPGRQGRQHCRQCEYACSHRARMACLLGEGRIGVVPWRASSYPSTVWQPQAVTESIVHILCALLAQQRSCR
jgi:hypothetical protein